MPVIVLATSGRDVLIAQSGKWVTDEDKSVFPLQKITGVPNTPRRRRAIEVATQRAQQLGEEVKFTPLEWKTEPDRFSTRFVKPGNPPGFLKGTFPDSKYPDEAPVEAAIREVKEETNFDITPYKIVPKTDRIFQVEIPAEQKQSIIQSWRAMGRQGELVDLRWEPISDIRKDIRMLNSESQAAVQYLPLKAGTRRRRVRKSKNGYKKSRR